MEDIKQIGLNIWGVRGEWRVFCHSDNLNVNESEIANTWKDIRKFVYVSNLNVRFYALEFTSNYKVFTLYRPENDTSRTGAYVATTLYVPHSLKINKILDLLQQISDAYHKGHYDAFGNPNTDPDYVQGYLEILKGFAGNVVKEDVVRPWDPSAQDSTPRILPFTSLDVVAGFFATPYRKEFLEHQEVMFWDNNVIQNLQSFGVMFQKEADTLSAAFMKDGEGIAPQFCGGRILNDLPSGAKLVCFKREGVDITANWKSVYFYNNTMVDIEMKKPFHQPKKYSGAMIGIGGCPFVKQGDDYRFNSSFAFEPYEYALQVKTPEVNNATFELVLGSRTMTVSNGVGTFRFRGDEVDNTCKVSLKQGETLFKVGDLRLSALFKDGNDSPDQLRSCNIDGLKLFTFRFNTPCSGHLQLRLVDHPISFTTGSGNTFEIVLPAVKKLSDFIVDVPSFEALVSSSDDTTMEVKLTKKDFAVEIMVPEDIKGHLSIGCFGLKLNNVDYTSGFGNVFAGIPQNAKNLISTSKLGIKVGYKGMLMPCKFDVTPKGDNVTLTPQLLLLYNNTATTVSMKLDINSRDTVELGGGQFIVLSSLFDSKCIVNADSYKIEKENKLGYALMTLTLGTSAYGGSTTSGNQGGSTSGYQGGGNYGGYSGGSGSQSKKMVGLYRLDGIECKLYEDQCTKLENDVYSVSLKGKTCVLCFANRRPEASKQEQYDAENKKNGFRVEVKNGSCFVETLQEKKPKGGDKPKQEEGKKRRWWLFGSIGLGALLLIGGGLFFLLKDGGTEDNKLSFSERHNSKIRIELGTKTGVKKLLSDERTVALEPNCEKITVTVVGENEGRKDTTITIDPLWFADSKKIHTICVNTLAWDEVYKLSNNSKATIYLWGQIADRYSSDGIKQVCADKAYALLIAEPTGNNVESYKEHFPDYYVVDVKKMGSEDLIVSGFKEALEKVWSLDCNKVWIDTLGKRNEAITRNNNLKEKKMEIVNDITKADRTQKSGGDWVKNLIARQSDFFSLVTGNSQKKLRDLKNNYTSYFSEEQQKAIVGILSKVSTQAANTKIYNCTNENLPTKTYKNICNDMGIELNNGDK